MKPFACSKCDKHISYLETFPNDLCVECYEKEFDQMTEEEQKPNFIKAINI